MLECHHVTGAWNYLLKVRVGTTRDLEAFLSQVVKATEGVQRTEGESGGQPEQGRGSACRDRRKDAAFHGALPPRSGPQRNLVRARNSARAASALPSSIARSRQWSI
ncbi:MAG: Lrp/AsnC ligand binding domain-containing protein [Elioraea tepidiphila]